LTVRIAASFVEKQVQLWRSMKDASDAAYLAGAARRLHDLIVALATAVEHARVVEIFVEAGRAALGSGAGFAWLLRDNETLELAAQSHDGRAPDISPFHTIAMRDPLPLCDAVRTMQPLTFESFAAITATYPTATQHLPYSAWVVLPFVARGRGIGVVSFSFDDEREFSTEDRELIAAMTHQASLALERCVLVDAERRARQRERQLHVLAARLSSALTRQQIAATVCEETIEVFGAYAASASLVVGEDLVMLGTAGLVDHGTSGFARLPLATVAPSSEAVTTARLVWCAGEAELRARYPHLEHVWQAWGIRSWGAVPFTFEGRAIGSLAMALVDARELAIDDRELLHAIGQLAAQALERARLFEAHQQSEEQLRIALVAARAATWSLDLTTMASRRDQNYQLLVGPAEADTVGPDFMSIHPDDRAIAEVAFARTLADGVPYEPVVRIRRDDGSYLWIQAHGRLMHDATGKPVGLAGVIIDIDEAKRASMRAEEERRVSGTMQRLASSFTSELDHDRLLQLITDEITRLVGAETGTFEEGDATAAGQLVVPLIAASGELHGRLHFGHSDVNHFTEHHFRIATGIAAQATIALENARLFKTVREHKQQLEIAIMQARLADRRKDEFLAMLGHELRNPLAPITTALELMDIKGTDETRRERDVLKRQVKHLRSLIDDLLDVSRIVRGRVSLTREVLELSHIMGLAIEMASPLLEQRVQRLVTDIPRAGLPVDADPTRLAQVFQNLLTNASKYSEPGAEIELHAVVTDDRVTATVRDRGVGMAAELVPQVFDLFAQGERSLARTDGGLGIGLTIARSLTELHGGTIAAASDGPGRGSTFTVTLPLAARVSRSAPLSPEVVGKILGAPGARVLVVDDNVDAAVMLRESLTAYGHELAIAHDGPSALELAASFKPDFAVLDIGLPVMNGYELARQLRERLGSERLHLIAVTGYGQDTDRDRSREVGFEEHLVKPIEIATLLGLLDKR
jgi:PAS domain S-box-containing protein